MKYKVINNNRFNVGIRFQNEANREILIKAKSFTLMSEDDILYVDTVSKLFSGGTLHIDDQELNEKMGYIEKNPNTISEEDIEKILKLNAKKMKEELEKLDSKHAIEKVVAVAKEADLPTSKLKVIKELFKVEILEEIDQEIV
ncbi:hypothetical protein [Bacillus infantis]|uniref:hypothetical protein n=1 Tax=Bacillus infantis TaxID=324767 RepID=UPI0020A1DDCB|nr:hypothetical protein [Bacillus infantis]MCP1159438.1 hypothetical protein [Bacillus infantis]